MDEPLNLVIGIKAVARSRTTRAAKAAEQPDSIRIASVAERRLFIVCFRVATSGID